MPTLHSRTREDDLRAVASGPSPRSCKPHSGRSSTTDRFHPDFVTLLDDGRLFVVEYKGEHLADTGDTRKKTSIGEPWAARSGGRGLFLMVHRQDEHGRGRRSTSPQRYAEARAGRPATQTRQGGATP